MNLYTTTKENDVVNEMDSVNEDESLDDIQDVHGKGDSDSIIAVDWELYFWFELEYFPGFGIKTCL